MQTPSIPSLGHTQFPNGETPVLSRENSSSPTGAQAQYHRVGTLVLTRRYSSTDYAIQKSVLESIGWMNGKRSRSTVGTRHAVSEKQSYHIKQTDTACRVPTTSKTIH
ncbi:MAG: hypothetical protein IJZ11_05220 [Bacteroidaceae bacterium]|nr:hypothetical protein [Bacteroidaceae bacterium]